MISGALSGLVTAVDLSRATMRNIRQNLVFAFLYNGLGIPIAAGVLYPVLGIRLSPMIAAAAMALSSLSMVTNANRLRRTTDHSSHIKTPATDPTVEVGGDDERKEDMSEAQMVTDPVCGMTINPAAAADTTDYQGRTYYFCSKACAENFKADPAKFTESVAT